MTDLWKKRVPGSIKLTVNGTDYTYYSTGIEVDKTAPKQPGEVELGSKAYFATGISFQVPEIDGNTISVDGEVEDNILISDMFSVKDNMLILS